MIYLEVVRVELVDLGMQFDNCGIIHATVQGLLFYMVIDVELGQEGLDIALVLND